MRTDIFTIKEHETYDLTDDVSDPVYARVCHRIDELAKLEDNQDGNCQTTIGAREELENLKKWMEKNGT